MIGFIYITTNLLNNKRYIGKRQINWAKENIDTYLGSSKILKEDIKKYGRENFRRDILCFAETREELSSLEKEYIIKYNAVEDDNFYNMHLQGERFIPHKVQSREHVKKRADKMRGCKRGKYKREKLRPMSTELQEQILSLYNSGSSIWNIYRETGFHCSGIKEFLSQKKLDFKTKGWQNIWTKKEEQELLEMYNDNLSCKEISKITHRNITYISNKLKELEVTLKDSNYYKNITK